jgi:membrane protease YdiL (CAAX protease family)
VDRNTAILAATFPTVGILLLNGYWNGPLYRTSPTAFWVLDVLTHVMIPAAMVLLLARRYRVRPADYGLCAVAKYGYADYLVLSVICTLLYWLSYQPVSTFFGRLLLSEPAMFTYFNAIPEHPVSRLLVGVYFSLSAAVFEEIMYRGLPWVYFKGSLRPKALVPVYVLVSATLFGFAHWENGVHELIGTFSLGVVACLIYSKTRNLWPLVTAHFLIDIEAFV